MHARLRAALLSSLLLASAGCLDGDGGGDDGDGGLQGAVDTGWAERAVTNSKTDDRHDHSDPTHHEGFTTPNFSILGYDPLVTDYHGRPAGGTYCGMVAETEERTIAVYHSFTTNVVMEVIDLSDVTNPELVGELVMPLTHVYDVSVTSDGMFAVLATTPKTDVPENPPTFLGLEDAIPTYTERILFRDACGNEYAGPEANLPFANGVVLVSLADLANPTIVDYDPQPVMGVHSISTETIDGTTYVAASTTNLVHGGSYYVFYTLEQLPVAGTTLQPFGAFSAQYPVADVPDPQRTPLTSGHVDATIQKHPLTGQVLAYLANWSGGLVIVELASPGSVEAIGHWTDYDPSKGSAMTGQWHSARPQYELRDGRHITLFGQEIGGRPTARPTSLALLMDTTDPTDPHPLARWTLPVDPNWDGGAIWSTHYMDLVGDTLFTSLYHGGVWAADIREENWPNLPSVGVFIPNAATPDQPVALYADWDPLIMEVNHLADGTLVILDGTSGVYTVRFTEDDPRVPPVAGWTEDDWTPE